MIEPKKKIYKERKSIYMLRKTIDCLEDLAKKSGRSFSEVVHVIVDKYLEESNDN